MRTRESAARFDALRSGIEKIITAEVAAFRCQFTQLLRHPTGKKIDRVPIGHPHRAMFTYSRSTPEMETLSLSVL